MEALERFAYNFLQVSYYFTGLSDIYSIPLLSLFFRLAWLCYLFGCMFLMFYWRLNGGDISIGGLVGTALFICNASAGIVSIFEVYLKSSKFQRIRRLQNELDELLQSHLYWRVGEQMKKSYVMQRILIVILILFTCEGIKAWMNGRDMISPVFLYAIPVGFALKARYIQVIVIIMSLNGRIGLIKRSVYHLALRNEPRYKFSSEIWQPYTQRENDTVNAMRLIYGHIYEIFKTINDCFGWSILCIFLTSFFDFVCNAFWSFNALTDGEGVEKYVFNGSTSISLAILVSELFWYSDTSWQNVSIVV